MDQTESNGSSNGTSVPAVATTNNGTTTTSSSSSSTPAPTASSHSLFELNSPFTTSTDQAVTTEISSAEEEQKEGSNEEESGDISSSQLTLRALVSTKEAGVIIGKGGKNVAELRENTGVKAGVSKVVQGVPDRVLSVAGTLDGVAKVELFVFMF
jgi:heterogeneous nuclear rnp K-like protein